MQYLKSIASEEDLEVMRALDKAFDIINRRSDDDEKQS